MLTGVVYWSIFPIGLSILPVLKAFKIVTCMYNLSCWKKKKQFYHDKTFIVISFIPWLKSNFVCVHIVTLVCVFIVWVSVGVLSIPLYLRLPLSLNGIEYRHNIIAFTFNSQSDNLWPLMGTLSPFLLNVLLIHWL